jgi:hypothetical protein
MRDRQIGQLFAGRLQEHGRAHFRFQAHQDLSYFVRLLTSQGQRTLWGKGLDQALNAAITRPKVGDLVGVRVTAREPITRSAPLRDRAGRLLAHVEHKSYRNIWQVEKIAYFGQRAVMARRIRDVQADARQTVQTRPELKSSFLSIRVAQAFAQERIGDPKDRDRFVELVRDALAASIQKGEPLPDVSIRAQRSADELTR